MWETAVARRFPRRRWRRLGPKTLLKDRAAPRGVARATAASVDDRRCRRAGPIAHRSRRVSPRLPIWGPEHGLALAAIGRTVSGKKTWGRAPWVKSGLTGDRLALLASSTAAARPWRGIGRLRESTTAGLGSGMAQVG
jgi:hypothetical protein